MRYALLVAATLAAASAGAAALGRWLSRAVDDAFDFPLDPYDEINDLALWRAQERLALAVLPPAGAFVINPGGIQ